MSREEVEHSVVGVSVPDTKFIDSVSEIISFWASKFVTQRHQPIDPNRPLVLHLVRKLIEPVEDGDTSINFLVQ